MEESTVPVEELLAHRVWVRALALRLARDESAAADLEQETWVAAMRTPPRRGGSVRAWLGTVVRNLARTSGRRGERRERHEAHAPLRASVASPEEVVAEAELQALLVQAVLALEEPYRSTVLLRFFHGHEAADIAARLGVPVETVRTRLKRALAKLRREMDERHGGHRAAWASVLVGPALPAALSAAGKGVVLGAAKKTAAAVAVALLLASAVWVALGTDSTTRGTETETAAAGTRSPAERARRGSVTAKSAVAAPQEDADRVDPADARRIAIRDPLGAPIGGATVEIHAMAARPIDQERVDGVMDPSPARTFRSREDGIVVLSRMPEQVQYTSARRAGFGTVRIHGSPPDEIVLLPACSLTGRVLDARGRGVAGAPVSAGPQTVIHWLQADVGFVRTVADREGNYALADLAPGTTQVYAGWPGGIPVRILAVALPSAPSVDLTLPTATSITGRVTEDGTGAPIADANVSVVRWQNDQPSAGAGRTGADGVYRIVGFPADEWSRATVTKAGWYDPIRTGHQQDGVRASDGSVTLDLVIARGGRIAGRITGPGGAVAGAQVAAIGQSDGGAPARRSTVSAADGTYALDGLPPGRALVAVWTEGLIAPGLQPGWTTARPNETSPAAVCVDVRAGPETRHDVVLTRGAEVSGVVLREGGAPAAGAAITCYYKETSDQDGPFSYEDAPRATAGADGRFALRGLARGVRLHVMASHDGAWGSKETAIPAEGDVGDVELQMGPRYDTKHVVHVEVVTADGGPIPAGTLAWGATLHEWIVRSGDRTAAFRDVLPVRVPADGRVDVPYSPSSEPVVVRVTAPGFAPADSEPIRATAAPVRLVLAAGVHFTGRVTTRGTNEPVAGATLHLRRVDPSAPPRSKLVYGGSARPVIGPVVGATDAQGDFDVGDLPAGTYEAQIVPRAHEWWTGSVTLPGDPLRAEVAPLAVLAGRVHFADGTPAAGVIVSLWGPDQYAPRGTTDADGRFRFDDAPSSGMTLHACTPFSGDSGADIVQTQAQVRAGTDVDLVVPHGFRISGTLLAADGAPLRRSAFVTAEPGSMNSQLRGDGTFVLRGLAPGRYDLRVKFYGNYADEDGASCPGADGVEAGTTGVALLATRGLSIAGTFAVPEGAPVSSLAVVARRPDVRGMDANRSAGIGHAFVKPDGRFRIDGLTAGRWRVVVRDSSGRDSAWQPAEGAIVEAGAKNLRLALTTATTISGQAFFEGRPLSNADVVVFAEGDPKESVGTMSWQNGEFAFVGLDPAKRWSISVYEEDMLAPPPKTVAVGAVCLRLELTRGLTMRGVVRSAGGAAAPKVSLYLFAAADRFVGAATSAADGSFEVRALPDEELVAKVHHPTADGREGSYEEIGRVRAGATPVELRLTR